jgi:hypothetical protein
MLTKYKVVNPSSLQGIEEEAMKLWGLLNVVKPYHSATKLTALNSLNDNEIIKQLLNEMQSEATHHSHLVSEAFLHQMDNEFMNNAIPGEHSVY